MCSGTAASTALTLTTSAAMPKSHTTNARDALASYFTLISNILQIGMTAATNTTVSLVTDAANRASERAVQPFNSLVKSATQQFFAPQISYPDNRWDGIVGSISGRARAMTGQSRKRNKTMERRGSVSHRVQEALTRSSSVPAHLSSNDRPCRSNKPTLRPLDIPAARAARAAHCNSRSASPLARSAPIPIPIASGPHLLAPTPPMSYSSSGQSASYSSASSISPLYSASVPESPYFAQVRSVQDTVKPAKGRLYAGEISRFSFWNIVGLGEETASTYTPPDASSKHLSSGTGLGISVHVVDDDDEEEVEQYRKYSY